VSIPVSIMNTSISFPEVRRRKRRKIRKGDV
jgi:ribosome-associated protein YbcJ (S4-like RNA binding protein)